MHSMCNVCVYAQIPSEREYRLLLLLFKLLWGLPVRSGNGGLGWKLAVPTSSHSRGSLIDACVVHIQKMLGYLFCPKIDSHSGAVPKNLLILK